MDNSNIEIKLDNVGMIFQADSNEVAALTGVSLHGYPVQPYSRGRLVYDNGEFVGEAGWGKLGY